MYHPPNDIKKNSLRRKWFPRLSPTDFLFGFVGANQFRKDPQKMLDAFAIVSSKEERARLYFHTDLTDGVYNLERYAADTDIKDGTVFVKPSKYISQWEMIELYSCLDCYVNCSMQEGLSWTVIEAMACGVPVVATDTTAQTELVDECAVSVGMNVPSYLPVMTEVKRGVWDRSFVRTKSCDALLLAQGMMQVMGSEKTRNLLSVIGRDRAEEYFEGMSDINDVLRESAVKVVEKIDAVLFAQHSSAGDVLMSTQCFEGIKKRHPDKKLVYMTQRQYRDIVEGNPYIDEIIDWNVEKLGKYSIVYNPHGEHILPGGWNNLDVKLYDMYPYFCKVEAGEMFIECVDPEVDLPERHIVVHTTGGNVEYRTYEHMDIVVDGLGVKVVQVGGRGDMGVSCADVDLRGKLTWRETAYVMKHAVAAVVIDSFPAHLAGCLDTPVVVLFGPAPARVTAPKAHPDRLFCIEPDMLAVCKPLHHCWGDVREMQQKCTSPCINTINPMTVREALRRMMEVGA